MGRVGDGRRRAEEVQSNDSGSLINFIRSNFSSRVIHHGGEGAFDHPSVSSIFSLNLLLLPPRTFPRTIIFSAKCHRTVSSLFPPRLIHYPVLSTRYIISHFLATFLFLSSFVARARVHFRLRDHEQPHSSGGMIIRDGNEGADVG